MRSTLILLSIFALTSSPALAKPPEIEAAEQAIRNADLQLCQAVQEKNKEKFLALLREDLVSFPEAPAIGSDKFLEGWSVFFAQDGPTIVWKPDKAEVFPTGDLGYTVGTAEITGKDKEGKPRVGVTTYLTVWRKEADGTWKAAVDVGTAPQPKPKG